MSERLLQEIKDAVTKMDARLSGVHSKVTAIDMSLNGTPEAPEKGVKIRLDRLEQDDCRRKWSIRLLISSVTALILTYIVEKIIK